VLFDENQAALEVGPPDFGRNGQTKIINTHDRIGYTVRQWRTASTPVGSFKP